MLLDWGDGVLVGWAKCAPISGDTRACVKWRDMHACTHVRVRTWVGFLDCNARWCSRTCFFFFLVGRGWYVMHAQYQNEMFDLVEHRCTSGTMVWPRERTSDSHDTYLMGHAVMLRGTHNRCWLDLNAVSLFRQMYDGWIRNTVTACWFGESCTRAPERAIANEIVIVAWSVVIQQSMWSLTHMFRNRFNLLLKQSCPVCFFLNVYR